MKREESLMGKKMVKAAVMTGPGKMEVQKFPYPNPRRGAMVIEMEMSGSSTPLDRARLYASKFREGMLEGNMTEGTLPCGAGASQIRSIKGAAEIVWDTIREAQQMLDGLQRNRQK